MQVKIVTFANDRWDTQTFWTDDVQAALEGRGYTVAGYKRSFRIPLRPELEGQPEVDQLVGPMYDGDGCIRYESAKANDFLST